MARQEDRVPASIGRGCMESSSGLEKVESISHKYFCEDWMEDELGLLFLNASLLASVKGGCVIHLFGIDILRFMERIKKLSCVLLLLLYGYLLGFNVVHCCRKL